VDQQRADCYVLRSSESRDIAQGLPAFKIRACDSGGLVSFFEFSLAAWEPGPRRNPRAPRRSPARPTDTRPGSSTRVIPPPWAELNSPSKVVL
jgi:hypothetical protein